jgi:hypothetical protein
MALAQLTFSGRLLMEIEPARLPIDSTTEIFWSERDQGPFLSLTRGGSELASYDFGIIPLDEADCAALSLRVSADGAFQADCLLGKGAIPSSIDFLAGDVQGLRLQPVLLPGLSVRGESPKGQGAFARGLHFPGIVTRSNVSLMCLCDECRRTFRLQPLHSGFAQTEYYYCGSGLHTLVVDDPGLSRVSDGRLSMASPQSEVEDVLPRCRLCGAGFGYLNPLRCPGCACPYIDFAKYPGMRPGEYYGNTFFGALAQRLTDTECRP